MQNANCKLHNRFCYPWSIALLAACGFALTTSSTLADEPNNGLLKKLSLPRPSLPQLPTKAAGPASTELPPKQAAQACLKTAEELFARGYDRESIMLFERARTLDPKQTQVAHKLAVLYDRQNDSTRALQEFQKALKHSPKDADLLNDMGYYYYQREDYPQAERWFRDALKHRPNLERAKINLGMTVGYQGRLQESFELFTDAVGPAAAHSNVGVLLVRMNRKTEAADAFRRALELQPDLPQARACLEHLTKPGKVAAKG